ncbi:V-type proton ATPase subunit a, vacuolar isoform [[Candida] anglica]|uniref:V-type proton ATPase subunit a n=1 Tax=[Candida] anglica TaxID=148631 RepID=A0ABP0EEJ4_9ASCO
MAFSGISLPDESAIPSQEESIFRSAPMTLVQFYMTLELARDVVNELGTLGDVHFRDLNSKLTPFQRTFVMELRKIDTVESQLSYLFQMMETYKTIRSDLYSSFSPGAEPLATATEVDDMVNRVKEIHQRISQLHESYTSLESKKFKLIENRYVINAVNNFHSQSSGSNRPREQAFDFEIHDESDDEDDVALLNGRNHSLELGGTVEMDSEALEDSGFNSISGSIVREKVPLLRKILWRTLRGNLFFHDVPIETESSSDSQLNEKNIFIIYIHGDFLKQRVRRIIQSLDGVIYGNVDGSASVRNETLAQLNHNISDLESVVESTRSHLVSELVIFQDSYVQLYFAVQREKRIYQTLNKFDTDGTRRCLVGEGWIPKSELNKIRGSLKNLIRRKTHVASPSSSSQESISLTGTGISSATAESAHSNFSLGVDDEDILGENDEEIGGSLIAVVNELTTNRTPPTFHKTNKFTAAFQSIIDAYGIATYQEVNPGLASIITFPFMFAIMFGDLGHGFIVFLISLFLIKNEYQFGLMRNKDEIFEMAFNGRYIILLMGFFSMYTGLIYNDVFSKSMTLFKSGWEWEFPEGYDYAKDGAITLTAKKIVGKTYWFGLDWIWHGTENNLLFTNSYKMKLSILMGFIHMNYSLYFSLVNYRFFKSRVDIIGNFIPGFLFMQSIFGYLTLTIIYKWSVDWIGQNRAPPGLLNMLINMFLAPGKIDEQLYPGQKFVQIVLVLIALVCVPWLLVYKPMVLKRQNDNAVQLGYSDLHSQLHHDLQLHEEEEALESLENELNHDGGDDEIDMLNGDFRFPNDIEPLNINSTSHGDHDEFNFGDIVIHQVIHTIEFCLNCVSHTASYLRLWALSLAHAQLSSVLWSMTIQNAFGGGTGPMGIFKVVVLFGMWFVLSVCILVLMEGTSAMLHSLRLHWVEAMSKFFIGEGYAYEPFTFTDIDY